MLQNDVPCESSARLAVRISWPRQISCNGAPIVLFPIHIYDASKRCPLRVISSSGGANFLATPDFCNDAP